MRRTDLTFDIKHPIILPAKSVVTKLLVEEFYKTAGHLGHKFMLANLRKKFWIMKGNSITRKVIYDFMTCKKLQSKHIVQQMADLPTERLSGDVPAFANVGLDCFGSFEVCVCWLENRKEIRRSIYMYG